MSTNKDVDINKIVLRAHRAAMKKAIDVAARTNTKLIVCEEGKVKSINPPYTYKKVPVKPSKIRKNKKPASSTKN